MKIEEKIVLDVEVGDTILVGRFKNKKLVVKDIGKDSHGMPTINGRKVTTFRILKTAEEKIKEFKESNPRSCLCEKCWKGYKIHPTRKTKKLFGKTYPNCIKNENKDEIKVLHDFLTKYTKSAKKASSMIKKYYKKVKKQFRGDSTRDVAMAIIGYSVVGENKRKPRKKGQHRNSPNHSDLYTDENPKGTIKGLKFATVKDAEASVRKINSSGKKHAHKIQAAVAMEQRAKEMGKASQAAVYRRYINKMKEKTKKMRETLINDVSPNILRAKLNEMSPEKRAFLMLRIYGDSWKVNLGKVFSGINKQKPGMIKKGLKEIKILNKKIEEMIEDLV